MTGLHQVALRFEFESRDSAQVETIKTVERRWGDGRPQSTDDQKVAV